MNWWLIAGLTLVVLAGLVVVLLAVPVELALQVERRERTRVDLLVGWLAGLVTQRITLAGGPPETAPPAPPAPPEVEEAEEPPPAEPEPEGPSGLDRARQGLALVRSEGFLSHTGRWLKRLVTSFSVRRLSLWLRFGTGDPADTGRLYGRFQAAMPVAYATPSIDVDLRPEFERTVFEAGGELCLRVTPLRLIWVSLVYALSPTTLRAVRAAWRARPDA